MIELEGKFNKAKVFTDNVESTAISQIIELCNQEFTEGSRIRIMPDTHAGAGCTIGTTMLLVNDKVVPNMVGVDIGCGMSIVKIAENEINFEQLDDVIRKHIPSGFSVRTKAFNVPSLDLEHLQCRDAINMDRALLSIGTLGGGNHFIEVNQDSKGSLYIVVHSGSRNLGKQVAEHYQKMAYDELTSLALQKQALVDKLTKEGNLQAIQAELNKLKKVKVSKQLAYLSGRSFQSYMADMKTVQEYAMWNRKAILHTILSKMELTRVEDFTTIHNYIDTSSLILRKGAVSAKAGELLLIPINMRDGSLLCVGKGNADWNFSAPHGAGRIMSRGQAKEAVSLEEYQESMDGIWTTSVNIHTLDESPMAYKPMDEIVSNIGDTVDILDVIKPLYNFKSN
jgi:RNA-splicing ligase RtcB